MPLETSTREGNFGYVHDLSYAKLYMYLLYLFLGVGQFLSSWIPWGLPPGGRQIMDESWRCGASQQRPSHGGPTVIRRGARNPVPDRIQRQWTFIESFCQANLSFHCGYKWSSRRTNRGGASLRVWLKWNLNNLFLTEMVVQVALSAEVQQSWHFNSHFCVSHNVKCIW